ncbi:hypothetical protein GT347_23440 [Xylophilus rhododendri]|uniref:Uncharacterized protein n=1 Tax=Xylophilus rhododendri TaxID=2697032 RepID=A0A857JAC3_9BURK|nr:hypothetical protein [Xylophilus rhododendri]QHJ00678.1 hypothetical protein GT347_23440 [Xylophilus rhododendri]
MDKSTTLTASCIPAGAPRTGPPPAGRRLVVSTLPDAPNLATLPSEILWDIAVRIEKASIAGEPGIQAFACSGLAALEPAIKASRLKQQLGEATADDLPELVADIGSIVMHSNLPAWEFQGNCWRALWLVAGQLHGRGSLSAPQASALLLAVVEEMTPPGPSASGSSAPEGWPLAPWLAHRERQLVAALDLACSITAQALPTPTVCALLLAALTGQASPSPELVCHATALLGTQRHPPADQEEARSIDRRRLHAFEACFPTALRQGARLYLQLQRDSQRIQRHDVHYQLPSLPQQRIWLRVIMETPVGFRGLLLELAQRLCLLEDLAPDSLAVLVDSLRQAPTHQIGKGLAYLATRRLHPESIDTLCELALRSRSALNVARVIHKLGEQAANRRPLHPVVARLLRMSPAGSGDYMQVRVLLIDAVLRRPADFPPGLIASIKEEACSCLPRGGAMVLTRAAMPSRDDRGEIDLAAMHPVLELMDRDGLPLQDAYSCLQRMLALLEHGLVDAFLEQVPPRLKRLAPTQGQPQTLLDIWGLRLGPLYQQRYGLTDEDVGKLAAAWIEVSRQVRQDASVH